MMTTIVEKANAIASEIVIAIALGIAYFVMLHSDPMNALTGIVPDLALLKLRLADLLKPFVLVCPGVAFTIPIASYLHNVETGRYAFGAYSIMPFVSSGLMLLTYFVSRKIGRSLLKDVTINGMAGILLGIVLSVNIAMIGSMTELVHIALGLKCMTKAITFIVGAMILNGLDEARKHLIK